MIGLVNGIISFVFVCCLGGLRHLRESYTSDLRSELNA